MKYYLVKSCGRKANLSPKLFFSGGCLNSSYMLNNFVPKVTTLYNWRRNQIRCFWFSTWKNAWVLLTSLKENFQTFICITLKEPSQCNHLICQKAFLIGELISTNQISFVKNFPATVFDLERATQTSPRNFFLEIKNNYYLLTYTS